MSMHMPNHFYAPLYTCLCTCCGCGASRLRSAQLMFAVSSEYSYLSRLASGLLVGLDACGTCRSGWPIRSRDEWHEWADSTRDVATALRLDVDVRVFGG